MQLNELYGSAFEALADVDEEEQVNLAARRTCAGVQNAMHVQECRMPQ